MGRTTRNAIGVALAATALAAAAALLHEPLRGAVEATLAWAADLGAWGAVVLAVVWIPAAVLLVPGSILTLGTGFLLGVVEGTVVVSIGSTAGAVAAFVVGRALLRDRIRERFAGSPRFEAVEDAVEEEGFTMVLLLRLSPVFPYNLQNYVYAATSVKARDFALASWIGMLPGTLFYVWLGAGARTLAAAATGGGSRGPVGHALFAAGLVATGAAVWHVTRRARRALERRRAAPGEGDG